MKNAQAWGDFSEVLQKYLQSSNKKVEQLYSKSQLYSNFIAGCYEKKSTKQKKANLIWNRLGQLRFYSFLSFFCPPNCLELLSDMKKKTFVPRLSGVPQKKII